ncbi:hypothetical protein [Barrientosiimonas humi]|uniref:hypothetical protein n=1 Tax=Barrientosiimonas humi TaxID=999931 RepID=UPI00370DC2E5
MTDPETGLGSDHPVTRVLQQTELLRGQQEDLVAHVAELEETLAQVVAALAERPVGGPWSWRHLDAYEKQALLVEVRDWVDWTIERYHVQDVLKPCWYQHSPILLEVIAVYVAWREAYGPRGPGSYTSDLTAWHDRWWWPMIHRIQDQHWGAGCNAAEHIAPPAPEDAPRAKTNADFEPSARRLIDGLPEPLGREELRALVRDGEAEWLTPSSKTSPVRMTDGTWWAILYNSPDGRWVPRPVEHAQVLERQWRAKQKQRPQPSSTGQDEENEP